MINILDCNTFKKIEDVALLWNEEVGFIYPITDLLFKHNIIDCPYLSLGTSFVAVENEKVVGFILSKIWDGNKEIPTYINTGWISLFYVARKYRNQGIGSLLLSNVETEMKKQGIKTIHIGRDVNNFFPGVPCDFDGLTPEFLEKRGYILGRRTHDLIRYHLNDVKEYVCKRDIRFATKEDEKATMKFFLKNFPGRWYFDACKNFKSGLYHQYLLAFQDGEVIGFMRMSTIEDSMWPYSLTWYQRFNNLGGLGPLGIDKDHRKQGIFDDMMKYGLFFFKKQGIKEIMIDWTSLMALYQKYGFEVWKDYTYIFKNI
jgi:GNAT superfamily N-acetyltransferase